MDTDRDEGKQAKLSVPPAEKTALSAKLQQERRVKLLAKSMRQSSKRPKHEQPGSSITGGTRQSVREGHLRQTWSQSPPGVCRKVTRAIRPKKSSQTLSCSSSRISHFSLHTKHPLLQVDEAKAVEEKQDKVRPTAGQ